MLLIGIDEAGYGPLLGPLCHGYSAIRCLETPDGSMPDLWKLLHPVVTRFPPQNGGIAVDDSKKLCTPAHGTRHLAQGISSFYECLSPQAPVRDADLYEHLLPRADQRVLEEDAWGRRTETGRRGDGGTGRNGKPVHSLRTVLAGAGVEVSALGARAMSARRFNAVLAALDNKADVSWVIIVEQLKALLMLARPGESIHVVIDRQSGRKFYGSRLTEVFSGAMALVEVETPHDSVYRIVDESRSIKVSFLVDGDSHSMPVALASMAAKLTRELCMARLNAFFRAHHPRLKPTAGYYADARRFLEELKVVREKLGIEDDALVRKK